MFNDYENFKKEFKRYEDHDWDSVYHDDQPKKTGAELLKIVEGYDKPTVKDNIRRFVHERYVDPADPDNDDVFYHPESQNDMVNSPAHYTRGTQECIDIIEEAIQDAPDVKAGMLQAQALKYLLRLWLKSNAPQDAQKAQWYLTRLIDHLTDSPGEC